MIGVFVVLKKVTYFKSLNLLSLKMYLYYNADIFHVNENAVINAIVMPIPMLTHTAMLILTAKVISNIADFVTDMIIMPL